ncbi:hypothetical protein [Microbacterium sp. A84]|uniref:hypothetical protein n=1 Tax=Microbacterium sp. A84 TaxID=3450715 RepID=UPI003F43B0BC
MNGSIKLVATTSVAALGTVTASWAALSVIAAIITTNDSGAIVPYAIPGVLGLIAMAWGSRALAHANEWVDDLPVKSYLAATAMLAGAAMGALAAMLLLDHLPMQVVSGVVAAAAVVLTIVYLSRLRAEIRGTRIERVRIARLRDHGRRVRAEVVEAASTEVWVGGMLLFEVTAEYETRSGLHRVQERLFTTINDAPTVGGTVLLWVTADGSNPTDVLMETDPGSIRHPEPSEFLTAPAPTEDA